MKNCHDCNAEPGQLHSPGCDVERCPKCGGQAISCGCRTKLNRMPWSGEWPGVAECREFGWYSIFTDRGWVRCGKDTPGASEDLNRLYGGECRWDVQKQRWVLRKES